MASKGIWKKELRAGRWKFLAGLPILMITAISIPLVYELTVNLMNNAPVPEFAKGQAALLRGQIALLKDFRFYIWSQWFGKNLTQMGAVLAVIFGAGIISSEVTRKTIHFLLAKPVRRGEIFTVKFIVNLGNVVLVAIAATVVLYITLLAKNQTYPLLQLVEQTLLAMAGISVIYSIAVYFSTLFDQTIKCAMASILVVFLLFIQGWVPVIAKYSLFYQMSGEGIYSGKGFPLITLAVFVVITLAFYYLGRQRFNKRNF